MTDAGAPVRVLYFAWMREAVGQAEETFALPAGVDTLAGLVAALKARGGGYDTAFARPRLVRAAVNQMFVQPDTAISPGDEVAFFPPVTGG